MSELQENEELIPDAESSSAPERAERPRPDGAPAAGEPTATPSAGADAERARRHADEAAAPKMKVVDKRFWARRESEESTEETDPAGPDAARPRPAVVEELQARLDTAHERLRQTHEVMLRAQKENDEFRERLRRDLERRVVLAKAGTLCDILEVADNLERALASSGAAPGAVDLVRGVEQVFAQLRRFLAAEGVEEVEVLGLPFDPQVAEALEVRETTDAREGGRVVEVQRRGYCYAGQLLRPARVVVGRAASPAPPPVSTEKDPPA
jgi:molecular chaperone GrpE